MSRSLLKQLSAGVHLVVIADGTYDGTNVTIRFSTGENLHHDQVYNIDSNLEQFTRLCSVSGIDMHAQSFRKESIGKRLYLIIKTIHDDGVSNNFLVDTKPFTKNPPKVDLSVLNEYISKPGEYVKRDMPKPDPERMAIAKAAMQPKEEKTVWDDF